MARGRRGGSPPDLRGTLGTLLRTTLQQVGMVKDAALRQAEAQRVWLDGALIQRKHKDALAVLGALVYERILSGELRELEEDRDVADTIRLLEELEVRMEEAAERARERAARAAAGARTAASSFASRAGLSSRGGPEDPGEVRVWRPVVPRDAERDDDPFDDPLPAGDDGTVSALGGSTVPRRPRRTRPRRAARGAGGIRFVDDDPGVEDEDLAEYMHPDDVPSQDE